MTNAIKHSVEYLNLSKDEYFIANHKFFYSDNLDSKIKGMPLIAKFIYKWNDYGIYPICSATEEDTNIFNAFLINQSWDYIFYNNIDTYEKARENEKKYGIRRIEEDS